MPQTSPPAQIGQHISDVDTPALLLDLDLFEQNIKTMTDSLADKEIAFRPHAKTHKCPAAALRQIAAGAIGVCCQKVGEAEVMAYSGIKNILGNQPDRRGSKTAPPLRPGPNGRHRRPGRPPGPGRPLLGRRR